MLKKLLHYFLLATTTVVLWEAICMYSRNNYVIVNSNKERNILTKTLSQESNVNIEDDSPQNSQEHSIVTSSPTMFEASLQDVELKRVLNNIDTCFQTTNIDFGSSNLLSIAKSNAMWFFREYRKVVPRDVMEGYSNHCWKEKYTVALSNSTSNHVIGHIGNITLDRDLPKFFYGEMAREDFRHTFHGRFRSDKVCIPNIYLLGFAKCGTTFLWCFISNVLQSARKTKVKKYQASKEPFFWTPVDYSLMPPDASQIGNPFIIHFLRAFNPAMSEKEQKQATLIDACAQTVLEWPYFREEDPTLANFCLYPSALPELFPNSKYVITMRDPVKMLYSEFWWGHTNPFYIQRDSIALLSNNLTSGPSLFHENMLAKINSFLNCMKDDSVPEIQTACVIADIPVSEYSACIMKRIHLLNMCVDSITHERTKYAVSIHVGIYYAHVLKWLSVVPRERLMFVVLEEVQKNPNKVAQQVLNVLDIERPANHSIGSWSTKSCYTNSNQVKYSRNKGLAIRKDSEDLLKKFFYPFNVLLSDMLDYPDITTLWN